MSNTDETTPALLRRAATQLRDLAGAASPGPWEIIHLLCCAPHCVVRSNDRTTLADRTPPADAAYIVTMSPPVAVDMADLLDQGADSYDAWRSLGGGIPPAHLVRLARTILSEAPAQTEADSLSAAPEAAAEVIEPQTRRVLDLLAEHKVYISEDFTQVWSNHPRIRESQLDRNDDGSGLVDINTVLDRLFTKLDDERAAHDAAVAHANRKEAECADLRADLAKVVDAWHVPGPRPDVHAQAVRALHEEWPSLARALDALAAGNDRA